MANPLDGIELLPADDEGLSPADDLAAAAASVTDDAAILVEPDVVVPFGRTWLFDYEEGRFVRDGSSPKEVRGRDSLAVWAGMVTQVARFSHPIFSARFGMDDPEDFIGEAADVSEYISDWAERLEEALTVHDRVTGLENFDADYNEDEGILYVHRVDLITDEEETLRLGDVRIGTVSG